MRDKRFVAEHRGGTLKLEQHKQLVIWACECVENVLPLIGEHVDIKLANAIKTAYDWTNGNATVGNARNASLDAIAVARLLTDPKEIAVARAIGHAVATPHMADHSLRAADYALKAIKLSDKSIESERKWQDEHLPPEIYELVQTAREKKLCD
ncbi:MAG: putative immunity protein [Paludibacter sp.]